MFDFGYFIRALGLVWNFQPIDNDKRGHILTETILKGICSTNDLDTNWHMNNARYLREADFGRFSLLFKSGLWNSLLKKRKSGLKNANLLVSAIQVQYRSSLQLGDRFEIHSRINGWDDRAFYIEQKFISSKTKNMICLLLVRVVLIPRELTPQILVDDIHQKHLSSPIFSPSIEQFRLNYQIQSKI